MDFRKEARHLQEFSAYLDASGMRAVATCPYVYKALSTQRCAVLLAGTVGSYLGFEVMSLSLAGSGAQPVRSPTLSMCVLLSLPGSRNAGIKAGTNS